MLNAGDVVDILPPENGRGSIRVIPKHHTQAQVARIALERSSDNTISDDGSSSLVS